MVLHIAWWRIDMPKDQPVDELKVPVWVCMGENLLDLDKSDPQHLCYERGCKKHQFSWGYSLPKEELRQLIQAECNRARLDELGGVQLEYGPYSAQTYINGQAMTVEERYAELQQIMKGQSWI